ncbi:MAG: ATP-binding cassette domain-containing protein [Pseudomonadota bacterium]
MPEPLVYMKDIQKDFGGKTALDRADLSLYEGEILGLVGDNGAGKSTMLKVLSGVLNRNAGEIFMAGEKIHIDSPVHSRNLGIEMVFQDLSLCESLTVWENVYLGRYAIRSAFKHLAPILDKREMARRTVDALAEMGISLPDVGVPVRNLSGGERQAVAICRCLLFHPRVILLDEPTASMAHWEQQKVLELVRAFKARGCSVIMVTHNLGQLFQVADRTVVMREGRSIWQGAMTDLTQDDLVRMMFLGKQG